MSHFDSQLQNCFVRDGKPEVGLGVDVLSQEGRQDLHLADVDPAVQEGALRIQHEGLVSCDDGLVLLDVPRGDKFAVLGQNSEATLSEKVLLHSDAAFLGLKKDARISTLMMLSRSSRRRSQVSARGSRQL